MPLPVANLRVTFFTGEEDGKRSDNVLKDVVVSSPRHVCFKNWCRIWTVSSPFFGVGPGHSQQNHNHLAVIIEIYSVCTFSITLLAFVDDFSSKKTGWWKFQKSLKPPPRQLFVDVLLNFFTQLVCCVILLCIAHTSAFVLMITIFCQHNPTRRSLKRHGYFWDT